MSESDTQNSAPATASTPAVQEWESAEFLRRFSQGERAEIKTLAGSNESAFDFLEVLGADTSIRSDDAFVADGLNVFVEFGILSESRREEIIGG